MATKARNMTNKLENEVKKEPFKVVMAEIKVAFIQDGNKTITVGLKAEVNDSTLEDTNDFLFNECLVEANRLLKKVK
jgi:hypothetical protein